jgi:hypothetical protein
MELDDARFPIRFTVTHSTQTLLWHPALFAALARTLELENTFVPRYTSGGAAIERERLRDGVSYDGFARVEKVRGKTVDGVKVALFDYTYFLRHEGRPVLVSCALDSSSAAGIVKPPMVWFSSPSGPLALTAELKARVKALQR